MSVSLLRAWTELVMGRLGACDGDGDGRGGGGGRRGCGTSRAAKTMTRRRGRATDGRAQAWGSGASCSLTAVGRRCSQLASPESASHGGRVVGDWESPRPSFCARRRFCGSSARVGSTASPSPAGGGGMLQAVGGRMGVLRRPEHNYAGAVVGVQSARVIDVVAPPAQWLPPNVH